MFHVVVTPFSFRGSVIKPEKLVKRLRDLGYKSVIIADTNFHSRVIYHKILKENGLTPIHSLVRGKRIYIAKNRDGYENLVKFYCKGIRNFEDIIVLDFKGFTPVMYIDKDERIGYEVLKKALGQSPKTGDFSLTKKLKDPIETFDVEDYDLTVDQKFPKAPSNLFEFKDLDTEKKKRIKKEVELVKKKGFENYFYTVKLIVETAKDLGIKVGPGRGSAVGSLLSYLLGITDIDPLKYGLIFERFINEGRKELPDIDIDVEDERRRELIEKLQEKFAFVSLISTYGTLKEKALQKLLKSIGVKPSSKLKELLYGLPVKRSIHAAGVVISSENMNLPFYYDENIRVCEYDMESLKIIGVEKIDILGLKTLSFMKHLEEKTKLPVSKVDDNEKKVFESISLGNTSGIFQLESREAKRVARFVSPRNLLELSHVLALNRPGPLKNNLDKEYLIRRLSGKFEIEKDLMDILQETLGLPIYQEQIMLMAVKLSGMSLTEADNLRKAVSKKDPEKMKKALETLENGMKRKGYDIEYINKIKDFIKKFASYAFNKSHSIAYAHLSYWLAYYKEKFFKDFFFSYLEHNSSDTNKIFSIVQEAIYRGYKVLNPNVNEPLGAFKDNILVLPIYVVKGVGIDLAKKIEEKKPYSGVKDFSRKVIGGATLENIIKAGSFDGIYSSRKEALMAMRKGEHGRSIKVIKSKFGQKYEEVKPESLEDKILLEMESMGFCLTTPKYLSQTPEIARSIALSIQSVLKALSLGKGIISDGFSTIVTKRNIPKGEFYILMEPTAEIIDYVGINEFDRIERECEMQKFIKIDDKIMLDCSHKLIKKG